MSATTNPAVTATKTKVRASRDLSPAENTSVTLARRTAPGSALRIGTLSWGGVSPWVQSPGELVASLEVAAVGFGTCDLILTAGLTADTAPTAGVVLAASQGTPVLFEAVSGGGGCTWFVAYQGDSGPVGVALRRQQILYTSDQWDEMVRLAGIVASGAGVIDFAGTDLSFLLLICGENNLLRPDGGPSVFRAAPADTGARLADVVGGPWAVLNPAHQPYLKQKIKTSGFGKIAEGRNSAGTFGPTLKRVVVGRRQYRDGTAAPVALVHVNNFSPHHPETLPYSSVSFGDVEGRVNRVGETAAGCVPGGTRQWRADVYEIRLEDG